MGDWFVITTPKNRIGGRECELPKLESGAQAGCALLLVGMGANGQESKRTAWIPVASWRGGCIYSYLHTFVCAWCVYGRHREVPSMQSKSRAHRERARCPPWT